MSFSYPRYRLGVLHRLQQMRALMRLEPFDVSTPEGISKERYRRVALTTVSSATSKAITLLTMLVSVPLTVTYLGVDRFGLWMTISSFFAFLVFADLGMGNGLLRAISEADGKDDIRLAGQYVSSGFFMLSGLAVLTLILFGCVYWYIPWPALFNVATETAAQEAGPALAVFVCCYALSLPLSVVQRVQLGYQEGFASNVWQMAGNLLGLGGLLLAVQLRAGLPWLVLAMTGLPVCVTLLNWLHYFLATKPALFPRLASFKWSTSRKLASTGFIFLLLTAFSLNWFCTDNLIIAQMLGAPAVAEYSIVQRLLSITMAAQFFILPLWPAYGEAIARLDFRWARKTLRRVMSWSMLLTLALSLPILTLGKEMIAIWTNYEFEPSFSLLLGWAVLNVLIILAGNLSSLLVHGPMLRRQVPFYGVASVVALALKITFASHFGVTGVVWGSVVGFGLIYTPFALRLVREALEQGEAAQKSAPFESLPGG